MDLLLGLDVGTTATKVTVFDLAGRVVASAGHPYGLITPQTGWVEQDPEALWQAVAITIRAALAQLGPSDHVLALAQSSQGGTTIPVDGEARPVYNAISWLDQRTRAECAEAGQALGGEFIYRTTGWPLAAALPLQHIRWFRKHEQEAFARTRYFLFVNDFIGYRLTGELRMDPSDASITQLFNIATVDWDERLLEVAGIRREQLSPIALSGALVGHLTSEASAATGLPAGTPVVNGAHDQYCAAVGTGATRPGPVMLSCGTAWVLLAVPADPEVGLAAGLAVGCHAVPGRWGALRSLGGVGTSLEWLLDNAWGGQEPGTAREALYAAVNEGVAAAKPGTVLFFPLAGGHAETFGIGRGGFLNLGLGHTRNDLARAVMEGVACELRWTIDDIRAQGVGIDELKMVGGAARSPVWPQIVASVTDLPVTLPAVNQAASWGAAVLAGVGAGVFADAETGSAAASQEARRIEPDGGLRATYDHFYAQYRAWSPAVVKGVVG